MFIHSVYFWLRPDLTSDELTAFEGGLNSLREIEQVQSCFIGKPATTDRPVVERGYTYALFEDLGDQQGHDAYQAHPIHKAFVEQFASYWTKIQVFDCE